MDTIREQLDDLQKGLMKDLSSLIVEYFRENENYIEQRIKYGPLIIVLSEIFGEEFFRYRSQREYMLKIMENFDRDEDGYFYVKTRHHKFIVKLVLNPYVCLLVLPDDENFFEI